GAAAARRERTKIAERLRLLQGVEGVRLARNRHVARVGRGQLQVDACVWAAFVELAGRVQEARAVARRGRALGRIAQVRANRLDDLFVLRRLFDVVEKRDVVAGLDARQMRFDGIADALRRQLCTGLVIGVNRERAICGNDRLLRQLAIAGVSFEQFLGRILRLLHVRLIEWIDAKSPTGERRRDLPEEELFAEIVGVIQGAIDHRMPGGFERLQLRFRLAIELADRDGDEQTIIAIDRRRAERLTRNRDDALAFLARTLGKQL